MTDSEYRPQLTPLRLDQLMVDRTVQRSLNAPRVSALAREFNMDAVGILHVSARADGTLHIMDGQHRKAAGVEAGHGAKTVQCVVYSGLSRAQEAALFRQLNNTRQIQMLDKFLVRVVEGDTVAVQLNKMLSAQGWRVEKGKHTGTFAAVAALESIYNGAGIYEGERLGECETVIEICTQAWGRNADGVRAEIISGLGLFLLRHGTAVDLRKLIAQLAKFEGGPLGLIGHARTWKHVSSGNIANALAEILTNEYNKGRRTNRLPGWRRSSAKDDSST